MASMSRDRQMSHLPILVRKRRVVDVIGEENRDGWRLSSPKKASEQ